jgi:DNA-directed RNA polymerase beta subunit
MERDCFLAHGVSLFLQERLRDVSDLFIINVCEICGLMATINHKQNFEFCLACRQVIH